METEEKVFKKSRTIFTKSKRIINMTLKKYKYPLICQKFIKDIKFGDRRIIFINGKYEGSVARIPKKIQSKLIFMQVELQKRLD